MTSTRLPGKVLLDIFGRPMLIRVVERVRAGQTIDVAAVITSNHESDNLIEECCGREGIPCFRGSLDDVLDRYYQAALHYRGDVIVRITADCPLIDPDVVDRTVKYFQEGSFDYVSNTIELTYPDGLDTEVFSFATLERAWKEARLKSEREHVTAYIYKHPEIFALGCVKNEEDLSSHRWTVDTPQDLDFVRAVYDYFNDRPFGMTDILKYLEEHPEVAALNKGQMRNEGYLKSLQEDAQI